MEKLIKINNEIYLLMQDIVKLIDSNTKIIKPLPSYNQCDLLNVKINIKSLIFKPDEDQVKKALTELSFLFSEWIPRNSKACELIYFIDKLQFSPAALKFNISVLVYNQLRNVEFNLSRYIDNHAE